MPSDPVWIDDTHFRVGDVVGDVVISQDWVVARRALGALDTDDSRHTVYCVGGLRLLATGEV